ncbi:alpha/beta fold hydrolase [Anaerorhabdus furcosa]|uniref:Alpha/beta hydrolase family protein n=1 Tax=Anaerorhabdus furcosa TaxID=118967 RepID=A0A1T4M3W5_9FIRM|nr:alpha/beta fold hydrolase [Anaerorhabdus furcosa]SJZ61690.1 Alpha/beta hydrolase family protein [Anaerorhabdus furcosa]
MKTNFFKKHKLLTALLLVLIFFIGYATYYLTSYLPASDLAVASLVSTQTVTVTNTQSSITFAPAKTSTKVGLIYYPGGKVDPASFAYAASEIAKEDIFVVIVKMPFNLAIFDTNKANAVMDQYPDIDEWYLAGFSLGGTAASMYAHEHPDKIDGLILYASYTTKESSLKEADFPVLSISGSNDGLATPQDILDKSIYLPPTTDFVKIEGANHTQMALYNNAKPQSGDNKADITDNQQQRDLIDATIKFIKTYSK